VDDDLGIGSRLEDRTLGHQLLLEVHGVGNVAVVGDRETAGGKVREQRLDVAQARTTSGRIAHVARGDRARKPFKDLVVREHLRDVPDAAVRIEVAAIKADDADRFLAPVLEGMEPQRGHRGGIPGADHSEDPALLAEFVAIRIEEGVREVHCGIALAGAVRVGAHLGFAAD
jgi:hypothetical protein